MPAILGTLRMNTERKQLKQKARETLLPAWGRHTTVSLILLFIYLAGTSISGIWSGASASGGGVVRFAPLFSIVTAIVVELLTDLFVCGGMQYFLKLQRGESPSLKDMSAPFRRQPDRFLIVGIVLIAAEFLCLGPVYVIYAVAPPASPGAYAILACLAVTGAAVFLRIRLALSMSRFLLLDDETLGAVPAMRESIRLMNHRKMKLFLLQLSMIGYLLLAVCTLFIGFIWVIPYVMTVMAGFYDALRKEG